jgi:ubiquinone/menaquinone biosynthesis C-methylase UbiE
MTALPSYLPSTVNMRDDQIKDFYAEYDDRIGEKRYDSEFALRSYTHRSRLGCFLSHIGQLDRGSKILEIGCGDGVLAVEIAKLDFEITASDLSSPNLERAKKLAKTEGVSNKINFIQADAEEIPFDDNQFDMVIASHVLEHLPNFEKGLSEVYRVTKNRALVALPTALNPCSLVILGGGRYWYFSKKGPYAFVVGLARFLGNIFSDGIDEGGYGRKGMPHLWRYPWVMKKDLQSVGFKIFKFEPDSIPLPFFNSFLPLIKFLDRHRNNFLLRNLGYGSHAVLQKIKGK